MPDHFYVYPAYLGHGLPRSLGRRIPAAETLPDLTCEEIVQAAKRLGYRAEVEVDKHYPRQFHTYAGRVKVMKRSGTTKARFLRLLAGELKNQRTHGGKA